MRTSAAIASFLQFTRPRWLSRLHISSTCDAGCQTSHNHSEELAGPLSFVAFVIPSDSSFKSSIARSPIPQQDKLDSLACGMPLCDTAADCFSHFEEMGS